MSARVIRIVIALVWLAAFGQTSLASAQSHRAKSKKHSTSSAAPASRDDSSSSSSDDLGDLGSEQKAAPEVEQTASSPAPEEPAHEETSADAASAAADSPADEPPSETAEPAAVSGRPVSAEPFAGLGMGTRSFRRPTPQGTQSMNELPFAAADVGMVVRAWPDDSFGLAFLVRYQTSVGFVVQETPPFALANKVAVRADRIEVSAAPTFRFGTTATAPRLAFPIGAMLTTFWPEVHNLMSPRYVMLGPHARAELQLSLTDSLSLRGGPEFQWIAHFSGRLTNQAVQSQGIALGAEANLHLVLSSVFALELSYRQSTAMANVAYGPTFRDVERFLTVRLFGTM